MNQRGVGIQGLFQVDYRRPGLVVNLEQLQRIAGGVGVGRGDHRHRLALVAGDAVGHRPAAFGLHILADAGQRQWRPAERVKLRAVHYGQDAGGVAGGGGFDAADVGVGVGAA